jgi:hypothetical protein
VYSSTILASTESFRGPSPWTSEMINGHSWVTGSILTVKYEESLVQCFLFQFNAHLNDCCTSSSNMNSSTIHKSPPPQFLMSEAIVHTESNFPHSLTETVVEWRASHHSPSRRLETLPPRYTALPRLSQGVRYKKRRLAYKMPRTIMVVHFCRPVRYRRTLFRISKLL